MTNKHIWDEPAPPKLQTQLDHYPWEDLDRLRYDYPGGEMDRLADDHQALGDSVRAMWSRWQYTVHGRR